MAQEDSASLEHSSSPNFTLEMVPDMKVVVWNGNHCFLMLVNLWANLISSDPPK